MTAPDPSDVDNILTCATNEGELYRKWCHMARHWPNISDSDWTDELRPYVRQLVREGRHTGSTSAATINAAAAAIRDYYLRHIQEL